MSFIEGVDFGITLFAALLTVVALAGLTLGVAYAVMKLVKALRKDAPEGYDDDTRYHV